MQPLRMKAIGKKDRTGNDYYFTRPDLPCLVDLSKIVIFVHPYDNEDGSFEADIVIKEYTPAKVIKDESSYNSRA